MSEKAKDPEVSAKKISYKPIDYEKLNRLSEDFKTCFTTQQELSAKQVFWFHILSPTIEPSYSPPVIVDVPNELPKVSLVNGSFKKLKFHLAQFDSMVKKRTTPSALKEGEWGKEIGAGGSSEEVKAGDGWTTRGGTLVVLSVSTWSVVDSEYRSTSLGEGGDGTEGPAKVIPLHVVIPLRSSRGLGTVLLGSTP
ncbi:hypothetical protein Tco_0665148 [Tanacetum coccineum]